MRDLPQKGEGHMEISHLHPARIRHLFFWADRFYGMSNLIIGPQCKKKSLGISIYQNIQ